MNFNLRITITALKASLLLAGTTLVMNSSHAQQTNPSTIRFNVEQFGLPIYLNAMAELESEHTPLKLNSETELVSVQARHYKNDNHVYYKFRLISIDIRGIDKDLIKKARAESMRQDANELCFSPVFGTLIIEYLVVYRYTYYDSDMRFIHGYDIDHDVCIQAGVK